MDVGEKEQLDLQRCLSVHQSQSFYVNGEAENGQVLGRVCSKRLTKSYAAKKNIGKGHKGSLRARFRALSR